MRALLFETLYVELSEVLRIKIKVLGAITMIYVNPVYVVRVENVSHAKKYVKQRKKNIVLIHRLVTRILNVVQTHTVILKGLESVPKSSVKKMLTNAVGVSRWPNVPQIPRSMEPMESWDSFRNMGIISLPEYG